MAFTMGELQLLERLAKDTDTPFPFSLSDEELDTAIAAVKRERGDKLAQIKRKIKTDLAELDKIKDADLDKLVPPNPQS